MSSEEPDVSKLAISGKDDDDDVDYVAESSLNRRHTSFGNLNDDEDDDDIMPEPTGLMRATSAPAGDGSLKSPFQRQKRRQDRKSLRQQNPNHKLHSLLPEDMQETEETDETSALARAREKRKMLLAKRNNPDLIDDDDEEEAEKVPTKQAAAIKDSVASSVSSISAGPLTPASASGDTFHSTNTAAQQESSTLKTTTTATNQNTATTAKKKTKKIRIKKKPKKKPPKPPSDTKRPKSLDQYFQRRRKKDQPKSALPPRSPSSPLNQLASTGGDLSVAEESLLPYSSNSVDGSIGLDLASLDGATTVSSNGATGALLKGYQEKLSKQLSELQRLCEQDNYVDNDEHSTYTNPDSRTKAKQDDDDDSSFSDSSGNLLMQSALQDADIRLTGRSLVVDKTGEESSVRSQTERLPSDRLDARLSQTKVLEEDEVDGGESSHSSAELKGMPAEEEDEGEGSQDGDGLLPSERLDSSKQAVRGGKFKKYRQPKYKRINMAGVEEEIDPTEEEGKVESSSASDAPISQSTRKNDQGEPSANRNAPPASQASHRGMPKQEKDKALAEMKTPKKSNRSNQDSATETTDDDDDDDSLEDLYRTDKWGRADVKGEAAETVVEENAHVSTTTKVVLATVAVVAGYCMRAFNRHRG